MKAVIANYRRGKHTQTPNQIILKADGIKNRKEAAALVGKNVIYKTQTGKEIKGKVSSAHGNSGCVRALCEKGLPGQALGTAVEII